MRRSTPSTPRAALRVATGVPLSLFLWNVIGAFVAANLVRGLVTVGTEKDKLRDEVEHFIEGYDELDDEALDDLLTAFIVTPYPTREGQDG